MHNFLNGKSAAMMLALSLVNVTAAFAQDDNSSAKEEGNRNVMLNAASANGPREIQIGLPSADVNVLENGLPVTYATNPHSVNTIWRGDASLSHQGLLKIAETAITTGNIGYAVNSFTQKGQKGFNGTLNYKSNHFGLQEFSLNMNGDLGSDWYYSFNMYQDFDPGTFKSKSTPYQDRTQIYKALLTKKYNGNRGEFTAMYRYANSHSDYCSNTTMYDQSVPADGSFALRVWDANWRNSYFYDLNKNASEYYKGSENKLALYFTHDWDVTNKLNLYYGARLEWQKLKGENAAVKNAQGGLRWSFH